MLRILTVGLLSSTWGFGISASTRVNNKLCHESIDAFSFLQPSKLVDNQEFVSGELPLQALADALSTYCLM